MTSILEVKKFLEICILESNAIMGVGLSPEKDKIYIYLEEEADINLFPFDRVGGYPVTFFTSGRFISHTDPREAQSRIRPVIGGISTGYTNKSTGTLSCVVYDRVTGEPLLMSNNHVYGNKSTEEVSRVSIGDPILQPGDVDSESPGNVIGTVHSYVPWVDNYGLNIADVALAKPSVPFVDGILVNGKVMPISGVSTVKRGETVYKVGRTTGLTYGKVLDLDFTSDIVTGKNPDGSPHYIRFVDQMLLAMESSSGDSGSLIMNMKNQAIGLLFAGGEDEMGFQFTIANKIRNVMAMAEIELNQTHIPAVT